MTYDADRGSHRIIIVGGGAGGLELATRAGRLSRKKIHGQRVSMTLIDPQRTHIWKPLLHEVAAGTLDSHQDEISYLAQAVRHHFRFRLGSVDNIDKQTKTVSVAPSYNESGQEIIPRREFSYDTLILAVGSVSHDFDIPGVSEHCLFLDTTAQAESFQQKLLETFVRVHTHGGPEFESQLHIAIVGGGATGVELAAQLHHFAHQLSAYGIDQVEIKRDLKITIIEAAEQILPALPERIASATETELKKLGVEVLVGQRVTEVTERTIRTQTGQLVPCGIKVWAAGIKAPAFLARIKDIETNNLNQIVVRATLQSVSDDNIFALGDCAACPWAGHAGYVPPRAQAAHQQASLLYTSIKKRLRGDALPQYHYRDYGSLVSLGNYSTVGSLMGSIGGSVMVEGYIARMVYLALYKMHQLAIYGVHRTIFLSLANLFRRAVHPAIKLH